MSSVTPIRARYEAGRPSPYHLPAPSSLSQDAELAEANPQLRDWARHLAANSSIVNAILDSRITNGVGTGLTYEPLVRDGKGNLHEKLNARIRRVIENWRRAPEVRGELSGAELESLAWRSWDTDGEIFVRQIVRRRGPDQIPYQLQLIESDLVPYWTLDGRGGVQGIEQDEWGRPLTYHVYKRRPADIFLNRATITSELVPIPATNIRHLKRMLRTDQTRGITLLHSVIFRIADLAEYAQSHRLAARASADLFASINRAPDWIPTKTKDGENNPPRDWEFDHLQILDNLMAGESVNFSTPEHPNQNATDFLHEEERQIAAGTRSIFSQIAMVFDRAFAAQRLEIVHGWRVVEKDRKQFIDDLARPALYEAPLRWAIDTGFVNIPRRGVDMDTLFDVRIDGPSMPTIDPVKDREAFQMDQEQAWDSRQAIVRRLGRNPSDVDAEREQDDFIPDSNAKDERPEEDET